MAARTAAGRVYRYRCRRRVATAASVMFGRKAVTTAKIGKGHPLKHRVLDFAAGAIQPKYPLDAMST